MDEVPQVHPRLPADLLASYGFFNKPQIKAGNLSRWAFLLTFAGETNTNFRKLGKQGLKPFAVGAVGEIVIAGITLVLVLFADHHFHL